MDNRLKLVGGVGLGAGLLFLLDPGSGRRRLKKMRDRFASFASASEEVLGKTSRDLRNRARGVVAQARARLREVPLEVHEAPGDVPGLQGGFERQGERFELIQEHWAPTARLLVGAAGGGLALYGATRRDRLGAALGSLGLGLLVRGLTDVPVRRMAGLDREEAVRDVVRTIHVDAPVEHVFSLWADYQNFPRFLSRVREVRDLGEGRSRWVVEGPAGVPVEWDAVLTRFEPNRELAWRTVEGSRVSPHGRVLFSPDAEGGTRVEVRLSYTPPAGRAGHALATLFGSDPESQMDEDLVRMKAFIETGRPPHDAAQP